MDIIIGSTGAIAGGLIMWRDAFFDQGGTIYTTLVATLGAVILTVSMDSSVEEGDTSNITTQPHASASC